MTSTTDQCCVDEDELKFIRELYFRDEKDGDDAVRKFNSQLQNEITAFSKEMIYDEYLAMLYRKFETSSVRNSLLEMICSPLNTKNQLQDYLKEKCSNVTLRELITSYWEWKYNMICSVCNCRSTMRKNSEGIYICSDDNAMGYRTG
jgi:hypothetical protein